MGKQIIIIDKELAFSYDLEKILNEFDLFIFDKNVILIEIKEQLEKILESGYTSLYIIGKNLFKIIEDIISNEEEFKKYNINLILEKGIKFKKNWMSKVIYKKNL